jgi:hypothetical protein
LRKNIEDFKRENTNNIKGKPITITTDFLVETLKARRPWGEIFQALIENNLNPRILYPAKLSFKINGTIKFFQ